MLLPRLALTSCVVLLLAWPSFAEPIPQSYLETEYETCIAGVPETQHARDYCRCFVDRLGEKLDFKEYLDLSAESLEMMADGKSDVEIVAGNTSMSEAFAYCLREISE